MGKKENIEYLYKAALEKYNSLESKITKKKKKIANCQNFIDAVARDVQAHLEEVKELISTARTNSENCYAGKGWGKISAQYDDLDSLIVGYETDVDTCFTVAQAKINELQAEIAELEPQRVAAKAEVDRLAT